MATRRKPKAVREPALAPYRYWSARRAFDSDAEMAEVLGVHRSNITRWKHGETSPENDELLVMLDVVVTLLTGFLEPETIPKWLGGINAHLGHRRPLDVLRLGHLSEVIRAIEAEKAGAFA
jgi:transcriptional regulator with XRE-family HTH domain